MVVYTGYRSVNGVFLTSFDARPGSEKFLVDALFRRMERASPHGSPSRRSGHRQIKSSAYL
jgi:hypothetical protein